MESVLSWREQRTVMHIEIQDRLSEIAELLAAGLMRVRARKSSQKSADFGESSVDFSRHQSGHAEPNSRESGT
jgi:hypothetical protein